MAVFGALFSTSDNFVCMFHVYTAQMTGKTLLCCSVMNMAK